MKINDYIKSAVSKIFNQNEKHKVEAELADHMLIQKTFNEEIGYDEQTAEEMAVEVMGDSSDISDQLASLHNDYYNPTWDIILTVLWISLLGAGYFILKQYIFDDIGTVSINLASIFTAISIFFISSFAAMQKSRIINCFLNTVGGIGTILFTYFVINNISKIAGNIGNLFRIITGSYTATIGDAKSIVTIPITLIVAIIVLLTTIISSSYCIKKQNLNNTLSDNHLNNTVSKINLIMTVVFVIISILCSTRFFVFQNNIKEKYSDDISLAFDIAKSCETVNDINEYIKNSSADFTEIKNKNQIIGYSYNSQIANIIINFNPDDDENKKETATERLAKVFANAILKRYPESYEKQTDYSINLSISNLSQYKNGYDSLSLYKIKTTPNQLDDIYNFIALNKDNNTQAEFLKEYSPANLYIIPSNNQYKHDTQFTYTYTIGSGTNAYNTDFIVYEYSEKRKNIETLKEKVINYLTENPDADNNQIEQNLGCTLDKKQIDDIVSAIDILLSYAKYDISNEIYEQLHSDERYKQFRIFKFSDDLLFMYTKLEEENIILFDSYTNITFLGISSPNQEEEDGYYQSSGNGMWRKIAHNPYKIHYSKDGIAYDDYENIPYYTKNGIRFRYEFDEEKSLHYLIGLNGEKYEANHGYIDKDGYLCFFTNNELKKNYPNEYYYHDQKGNIYTKALETSWDKDGNILDFEEYNNY